MNIKGKYIVWTEKDEDGTIHIYSTDSKFWKDFFNAEFK